MTEIQLIAPPAVSHPCTKKIKICLWGDSHLANNRGFPNAVFQMRFSKRGFPNALCRELDEPNIRFHLDLTNNAVGGNKMYQKNLGLFERALLDQDAESPFVHIFSIGGTTFERPTNQEVATSFPVKWQPEGHVASYLQISPKWLRWLLQSQKQP